MSKQLTLPDLIQGRAYLEVQFALLKDVLGQHPDNDALHSHMRDALETYEQNTTRIDKLLDGIENEKSRALTRDNIPLMVETRLSSMTRTEVGNLTYKFLKDIDDIKPSHAQNRRIFDAIQNGEPSVQVSEAKTPDRLAVETVTREQQ